MYVLRNALFTSKERKIGWAQLSAILLIIFYCNHKFELAKVNTIISYILFVMYDLSNTLFTSKDREIGWAQLSAILLNIFECNRKFEIAKSKKKKN